MSNWPGLAVAYVYIFGAMGVVGALCRWRGYSPRFASRIAHIAVGMWIVGTVLLFQSRFIAVLPLLSLALFNFIIIYLCRHDVPGAQERNSLGLVYLPLSLTFMTLVLWEQPGLLVASLMPLTWGDTLAAIMGHHYGQYHYQVWGHDRTLEGSLSMFIFSLISLFLALLIFSPLGFWPSLLYAFITAVVATGVEAASLWGMDNLFLPVVCGALLRLLAG
jgi:phytol kinase